MDVSGHVRSVDDRRDRLTGVILGTAVGDAIGLPREGLSGRRAARMFRGPLRHRFLFGRGMISDDAEHACMTAQAILGGGGGGGRGGDDDVARFRRSLAWRLRGWLLGLPAGVGLATLRSILKLWIGFPPTRSGVWSAGNGPAMRAAVIGAAFASDPARRHDFVQASTVLTHRDPRALRGALLVAHAAATGFASSDGRIDAERFIADAMDLAGDDHELLRLLALLAEHHAQRSTPRQFADAIGCATAVGGYVYQTVPVCLFCWIRAPSDFRAAVSDVIALGGDTDTTGAIVGGLVGATAGAASIPSDWLDGVMEYPRSTRWMRELAERLANTGDPSAARLARPLPLPWPALLPRNVLFLLTVLIHGVRRVLPPY